MGQTIKRNARDGSLESILFLTRYAKGDEKKKYNKILAEKPKATDHMDDTSSIKLMLTEYSKSWTAFI